MPEPISLLFGVHAHQPVGNFEKVIDEAHLRCYRPFLQILHGYPQFRFAAHFSGWLLGRLIDKYPEDLALLQEMVARGQVELFGGGDCEPVLAAIPARDRIGQIQALNGRIERHFGVKARGAWLTERVYIPTVVPALVECGMRYLTVDDYHFLCTGKSEEELDGFYTTEEDNRKIDLFPISEALRYRFPFSPAAATVNHLEDLARQGRGAAIYFDDIEKFGIWPETYQWVYEKGWLRQFIEGVLASSWIRTETFDEYHARCRTRGIIYLPTTSYIEMNEWTLPPRAAAEYADLVAREKLGGHYARSKAFVRGGIWKNFFMRYPEANWMHKRMLGLSHRLDTLPVPAPAALVEMLYRAQANDAYWHGLFGGLYLPHLRRVVWRNLLELECTIDRLAPRCEPIVADRDCDGIDECLLADESLQVAVVLDAHGALCELDGRALAQNFGDTLTQREEHYYHRLGAAETAQAEADGIASAHDRLAFRHPLGVADAQADARPRRILLDAWMDAAGREHWPSYASGAVDASGFCVEMAGPLAEGRVKKTIGIEAGRLRVRWQLQNLQGGEFRTELNLALPSCDGYSGRYILADGTMPCGFGQDLTLAQARQLTLDDRELGGGLSLQVSPAAFLRARPHYTVSQSEAGFEKVMQAASVTLAWPVREADFHIELTLAIARDAPSTHVQGEEP